MGNYSTTLTARHLKTRAIGCTETSVPNCQSTMNNIPEERRSYPQKLLQRRCEEANFYDTMKMKESK